MRDGVGPKCKDQRAQDNGQLEQIKGRTDRSSRTILQQAGGDGDAIPVLPGIHARIHTAGKADRETSGSHPGGAIDSKDGRGGQAELDNEEEEPDIRAGAIGAL